MAHVLPCPACRKKVSEEAATCPKCGHPLAGDEKFQARRKSRRSANAATWLVALGLLCYCGSRVSPSPEKVEPAMIPVLSKAERDARAQARAAAQTVETRSKLAAATNPPDQEGYEVVGVIQRPPIKLAIDVRLEEPIPEDDLVKLAHKLYSEYSGGGYARVFMTYRLPETPPDGGAWATTHWNPHRKVKILGIPAGAAEELAKAAPEGTETLGQWEQRMPLMPGVITVYREGSQWLVHTRFKDGSEMTEKVERSGDRITIPGDRHGGFYRLTSDGRLEVHERDELIGTARQLR